MKRLAVLFLIFCFAFSGCVSVDPQIDPNLVTAEIINVTDKSLTYEITNNSKDNIVFGNEYYFEYKDGENWAKISDRTEIFFTEIAHILEPGQSKTITENFEYRYGALSSGTYRVVKDIRFENQDGTDFGGQILTAEFEVIAIEK